MSDSMSSDSMSDYYESFHEKCRDYQEHLGLEVIWCVDMKAFPDWTLETFIIPSKSELTMISTGIQTYSTYSSVNMLPQEDWSDWKVTVKAKNGTVRELWKAANESYKKASELYYDWHRYIEVFEPHRTEPNIFYMHYGS